MSRAGAMRSRQEAVVASYLGSNCDRRSCRVAPSVTVAPTEWQHLDRGALLDLQAKAGNAAVANLLAPRASVQRKACCSGCKSGGPCDSEQDKRDDAVTVQRERQAGNAAVAQLLEDGPKGDQKAGPLSSPMLAGHARLQEAATNAAKALRRNERSDGVQALQHALVELGFTLPKTTAKGTADGVYGQETHNAVRDFQQGHGVRPVGGQEVGPKTLKALDEALAGRPGTTPQTGKEAQLPSGIEIRQTAPGRLKPTGPPARNPEAQTSPTGQTKVEGEGEGGKSFEVEASLAWSGTYKFDRGPQSRFEWEKACDQGEINVTGKFNLRGIPVDKQGRFKLFPELSLDVDLLGVPCGKLPGLMANFTWWKFQAWKAIELSMNSGLGIEGPPFGWVAKPAGIEVEVKLPGNNAFGLGGEIEHKAEGDEHSTSVKGLIILKHSF